MRRHFLVIGLAMLVAGGAFAQGLGLGMGIHEMGIVKVTASSLTSCGALQADHTVACDAALVMLVGG